MKNLRVMHIIASLKSGGVERLLAQSLSLLQKGEMEHQVCCITSGGVYEAEVRRLGIPVTVLSRRSRFDPGVVTQLAGLLRREKIEVVHTLNFTANAWGRTAAIMAGTPRIIAHERGTAWTENTPMQMVDRLLYRRTDLLLANSEATKKIMTGRVGLPAERIRVVYNGLPAPENRPVKEGSFRQRLKIPDEAPLVVTLSRLDTPKGLPFLLQAVPLVWETLPEAHFVLFGEGPLQKYLETEAARLGLLESGRFHMAGFAADAPGILAECELMLHSTIQESFGNALIEAALAGVPVIASNVDGCAEVIVDGETGLLIDCTEPVEFIPARGASPMAEWVVDGTSRQLRAPLGPKPEALAQAAIRLLCEPQLRKEMGARARARAQKMFSLERYVGDLEKAYRGELE